MSSQMPRARLVIETPAECRMCHGRKKIVWVRCVYCNGDGYTWGSVILSADEIGAIRDALRNEAIASEEDAERYFYNPSEASSYRSWAARCRDLLARLPEEKTT